MFKLSPEKKYRMRLLLPVLACIVFIPLIFVILISVNPDKYTGETTLVTILYFLFRYILPLILMPISIYLVAKKKELKRMFTFLGINIAIGFIRLGIKSVLHFDSEFQLLIAALVNVYGRINLEQTGKIIKAKETKPKTKK